MMRYMNHKSPIFVILPSIFTLLLTKLMTKPTSPSSEKTSKASTISWPKYPHPHSVLQDQAHRTLLPQGTAAPPPSAPNSASPHQTSPQLAEFAALRSNQGALDAQDAGSASDPGHGHHRKRGNPHPHRPLPQFLQSQRLLFLLLQKPTPLSLHLACTVALGSRQDGAASRK